MPPTTSRWRPETTTSPASSAELAALVAERLSTVTERLTALGRADVRVVAVTKTFPVAYVDAALACGLAHIGENYASELVAKKSASTSVATWHFLGRLQTNKIALVAQHADVVSTVCRVRELDVLARQPRIPVVDIEVDVTGAPSRNGAALGEVEGLLEAARARGVAVRGLMTVAPPEHDAAARCFADVATVAATLGLAELSMGMSADYELAVAAGSTEVRLGNVLFHRAR